MTWHGLSARDTVQEQAALHPAFVSYTASEWLHQLPYRNCSCTYHSSQTHLQPLSKLKLVSRAQQAGQPVTLLQDTASLALHQTMRFVMRTGAMHASPPQLIHLCRWSNKSRICIPFTLPPPLMHFKSRTSVLHACNAALDGRRSAPHISVAIRC